MANYILQPKQKKMTPFEQAVEAAKEEKLQTPEVFYEGGKVDYFKYQLATHKMFLSIMSKGMQVRSIKLKDLKQYYGLKGKTAADCLPQFLKIMESHI